MKTGHEDGVPVLGEAELDDGAGVARNHAHVVALAVHFSHRKHQDHGADEYDALGASLFIGIGMRRAHP